MTIGTRKDNREDARQRFLSLKDVEYLTSLKKSTIYALVQSGGFPNQHDITLRRRGWLESEVEAWIASRCARQNAAATNNG